MFDSVAGVVTSACECVGISTASGFNDHVICPEGSKRLTRHRIGWAKDLLFGSETLHLQRGEPGIHTMSRKIPYEL